MTYANSVDKDHTAPKRSHMIRICTDCHSTKNFVKINAQNTKFGQKVWKLELVFVKHYAPNCLTLTLFDSNTA